MANIMGLCSLPRPLPSTEVELKEFLPPAPKRGRPRSPYITNLLKLQPVDAAWIAAILDGEGSVYIRRVIRKDRKTEQFKTLMTVTICYNTDWGIISKAMELVPWAYIRICIPSGFNKSPNPKTCYSIETSQRELMYDILTQVLPYMAHTGKKMRAREILANIEGVRTRRSRGNSTNG